MHSSEIIETLYIKGSLKRISVKGNTAGDTNWTYDGTYTVDECQLTIGLFRKWQEKLWRKATDLDPSVDTQKRVNLSIRIQV